MDKLPEAYRSIGRSAFYGFWLLLVGIFLFNSGFTAYEITSGGRTINGPFDPVSMEVYQYIKAETAPDSVIVFWKPRAMRLFTGHDTFMSTECSRLPSGNYVVISKKAENSQIPPDEIDQCNLDLEMVFENQRFIVYKVVTGSN